MRKYFTLALVFAAMGAVSMGCGGKGSGSANGGGGSGAAGGGGSGGTTNTTTTTTATGGTTTTTTTTTMAMCTGVLPAGDCGTCDEGACCDEIAACNAVTGCIDCLYNGGDCSNPDIQDPGQALLDCQNANCGAQCTPPCNPVTNEPCNTAAGEACDFNSSSPNGFTCYPSGNTHKLCEACGSAGDGNYCEGGMTCFDTCAKFCCDDADCGTGTCNKDLTMDPNVGICVDAMMKSACDAPQPSPSNGSCVQL